MGCTSLRKPPPGTIVGGGPGQIQVAGAPTVTTYQNNDGSYVLGATHIESSAVHAVPPSYGTSAIRPGESTNNQFLSPDIFGAQSKIIPPQPPSYSPTAPPMYTQETVSTTVVVQPPPAYGNNVGNSKQFRMPMGPSTQQYYELKYRR